MAQISGVPVTSITSMRGVAVASIVSIGGVATSTIPGWPGGGSGPTLLSAPTIPSTIYAESSIFGTSGSWTGTGSISYTYNWLSGVTLVNTQTSPFFNPKSNQYEDIQPFYNVRYGDLFTNLQLQVTASDSSGSTVASSTAVRVEDSDLVTFLANSGITNGTTISALEGLQKGLKSSSIHENLLDYYPFAGTTANQQKWSLKYPNSYLEFNSGWTFSSNGAQASGSANGGQGTFASSSTSFSNTAFGLTDIGIYNGANITEDSIDIAAYYLPLVGGVYSPVQLSLKTNAGILQINLNQGGSVVTASINSPLGLIGIGGSGGQGGANSYIYTAFQSRGSNLTGSVVGQWSSLPNTADAYTTYKIRIGAGAATTSSSNLPGNKLYQFAYAGYNLGFTNNNGLENYKTLGPIIQNYQAALERSTY